MLDCRKKVHTPAFLGENQKLLTIRVWTEKRMLEKWNVSETCMAEYPETKGFLSLSSYRTFTSVVQF